ncbi:MAG: PAS domain S-box protein [Desulfobaccales bacterium]
MTDTKDLPPDFKDLRRRAEALLEAEAISPEDLSPAEAARLIHELRVHQIELEMQNEELRLSQARLEESRSKYADLYDFAPVGYLTLDERGRIVEVNLTAATLLGVERGRLIDRLFAHFLVDADRRIFRQLMNNSLQQHERRGEFHLKDGQGEVRAMLLDILFLRDAEGRERRRVSLTDINELTRTQEELRLHKEDLEDLVAQLREANDQLRALFAAAPLAIGVFDAEGRLVNVNPASERIFGWSPEEVLGRLPLSIPQENQEESLAALQRVLQGESFTGMELKQQRQDGSLFDASLSAAPLHDTQGNLRGFVALAEDVTERKQLEEATRTQAKILESMAEGVAVTDDQGAILYTNPAFDAMFGYEAGELLGRHSNVLNHYPPEESLRIVQEILDQVNNTGLWTGEFHNCKKDGRPFFTMTRISALSAGGKKLYISVQEDITQKKRAQERLERQAELLDLAHDAILVRDQEGSITYWNQGAAKHYGWTREAALGQISHNLLKTAFPQPLLAIERQLLEKGFWEGELTHVTKQGHKLVMNCRWTVKRDDKGRVAAILEINQDVTAQKQIEQEVHRMASFPLLNPNPVLEMDEDGQVMYANPVARSVSERLRLTQGVKAFLPPNLKDLFAAARQGGPRQYSYDLPLKDRVYSVELSFPHDLPTARLYLTDITERKKAEEALRESEARYRSLVELSPDAILVFAEGKYVFANSAAARLFGATAPAAMVGQNVVALVHPDYREFVAGRIREVLDGDLEKEQEVKILRLDGQPVDIEASALAIHYQDRQAILLIMRDITARKRAEQELARQRELLQKIIDNIPVMLTFYDPNLKAFSFNQEFRKVMGWTEEDISLDDPMELFYPDPCYREEVRRYMQSLEPGWRDVRVTAKDGGIADSTWANIRLTDDTQIGIGVDIRERLRAEEALRQREAKLSSIFAAAPVGIGLVVDRVITDVNEQLCQMTGYAPEELLGKSSRLFYRAQEDFDYVGHEKYRQIEEFGLGTVETRWQRQDGAIIDVLLRSSPMVPGDASAGMTFTVLDITGNKQAEKALRESEERYRSLFENNSAAMFLIDPDTGVVMDANPAACAYYGYAKEELLARRITDINTLSPEQVKEEMQQARAGERKYFEFKHRLASGQIRDVEVFSGPISVKGRELLYSIVHDNTARKEAEKALRESRRDLNRAQAVAHIGSWRMNVQKNELTWSEENHRIFGIPPGTPMTYETFLGTVHPEDRQYVDRKWMAALKGEPYDIEHRLVVDGTVKWVREVAELEFGSLGQLLGGFGTTQDITGRKEMEEALRRARDELEERVKERTAALRLANEQLLWQMEERQQAEDKLRDSEARFAAFMEHLPGLAVMRDIEGHYLFANLAWEKMMGVKPGSWMGKGLADLWPAKQAKALQELDFRVISSGKPMEQVEIIELADGPHHFLTHRFPIGDHHGLPYMVGTVAIDVTARQRAEEALAAERQRLYALLEQIPAYVVLLAPDYTVPFANREFIRRFGEGEEGQKCYEVLFGSNEPCPDCQTFRVLEENQPQEWEWLGPDGRTYAVCDYPFTDADGSPLILKMGIDITERKQAEEALRASEQKLRYLADQLLTAQENERKRLAAELHDELGHALLALKLALSSIEKRLLPEQESIKEEIRSQLDYINEVIQEVRRLYHDLSPGYMEDLGLTKALYNLINDFAAHVKGIAWHVDLVDLEGLFPQSVQTIIYRIMQEALTNIGKHAHPTLVTISSQKEADEVHFVVQNNGTGFNVQEIGAQGAGRGVGLVAMEERLNMLGGTFEIQSREQEGTRLMFTIPTLPGGVKP